MADAGLTLNSGSGGSDLAGDNDASSRFHQYVKMEFGGSGTQTHVTSTSGLPVAQQGTWTVTVSDGPLVSLSSGTVAATQSGTWNITNISGTVSLPTGAATAAKQPALGTAGSAATDVITVQGIASMTALKVDGSAVTQPVVGAAAHDAAVSGNPVLLAGEARTSNGTAVANGDTVRLQADDLGRQVIQPFAPRDLIVNAHLTSLSATSTQTLLAAGGAGVFRDLVTIVLSNRSAATADVQIYDGLAAGTEMFRYTLAASGGGSNLALTLPLKQATANNGWAIRCADTTDVSVTVQAVDTV